MAATHAGIRRCAQLTVAGGTLLAILAVTSRAQPDPNALADQARRAMAERRFADAAAAYGSLAESYPNEPSLQVNLGMALHLSARDQEAVGHLRKAATALDSSFPAHFFLGASLSRLGESAQAVEPLRQATRLDPRHPFAKALLGDALEAVKRFSEAADVWRSLREVDGQNPYPYAGLVRCHEQLAARAAEELRNRDPESSYVFRLLGHSRLAANQYPSALFLFRQALEREPGVRQVHQSIAKIYESSGRADWAAIERRVAEALPIADCAASQSAACAFANGRFEDLPPLSPTASAESVFWTARAHAALAQRAFGRLAALQESPEKLTLMTDILASQGRYSKAADTCQRALALVSGDGNLERQLAELLYLAKRIDEARPLLERFQRSDAGDPRWPAMLGNLLAQEQDYQQAIPLLESALAQPGSPLTARLDLGRSYLALDRPAEAAEHLRASLDLDSDGSVHYQLAQAYQRLGQREQAREALERYRELDALKRQEIEASASLELTAPD